MPIPEQKVLEKISNEVNKAMLDKENPAKLKQHIQTIRLLTDLFLDEDMSTDEAVVMEKMKQQHNETTSTTKVQQPRRETKPIDHDEANGDSIFDF
ncbi:YwdI family protein [Salirhabdus salicampi]|uniref:YwdI family protein n=1 Tax=Salirhabdus salicampi TaxID=476102 RepID=UPI0020C2BB69|nr:YwdI family protein [Salirhabdus salicampi]